MTIVVNPIDLKGPTIGIRHLQAALLFLGIVVAYIVRGNVGVAVVAMTNAETTNPNFMEFDWNEKDKSFILSSFYWGYCLTQFLGGYLCKKFGAKIIIACAILISAATSLITPPLVTIGGWQVYCALRGIQGAAQGLIFPCVHQHLAKWAPKHERNRLGALANSGIECGTVLAMGMSGLIAASSLGWPGISYLSGCAGIVWIIMWWFFGANSPQESKHISNEELKFIESNQDNVHDASAKPVPTPWRAMFTSLPFIALVVTRCSESWGFSTMQAEIPSYMNGVLYMDIKSNALFSALPYLVMWIMSYVYLISADLIIKNKWLSLVAMRKTFNSIAFFIPAVTFIIIGYLSVDQKSLAIAMVTINVGVNSAATIGSALNTIDLAPNHAGMQMGIINTAANIVPILTPLMVGFIVQDEHDRSQWQVIFIISAVVFVVGNSIYLIFGSADLQPWNDPQFLLTSEERKVAAIESNQPTTESKVDARPVTNEEVSNEEKEVSRF